VVKVGEVIKWNANKTRRLLHNTMHACMQQAKQRCRSRERKKARSRERQGEKKGCYHVIHVSGSSHVRIFKTWGMPVVAMNTWADWPVLELVSCCGLRA
jgi:hypothetical protein